MSDHDIPGIFATGGVVRLPRHCFSASILFNAESARSAAFAQVGVLIKHIEEVALACAARYTQKDAITLSIDQVMFRDVIKVGEFVTFLASVNYTGLTSIEIGVKVIAENVKTQKQRHVTSCYLSVMAVDDGGHPSTVSPWHPTSREEHRRYSDAVIRMRLREGKHFERPVGPHCVDATDRLGTV